MRPKQKKPILFLLFLAAVLFLESCSPKNTHPKELEITNQLDTVVIYLNDSISELKIFRHEKLFAQGKTLNNQKDDYWVFYFPDGKTVQKEGSYWKNLQARNWGEYYESGKIKSLLKYSVIATSNDSTDYIYKSALNLRRMVDENNNKIMDSCFYYSINGNPVDFIDTMRINDVKTLSITYINPSFGKLYLTFGNYVYPFLSYDHTKEAIIKDFVNHSVQIELKAEKLGLNHFVAKITDFKTDSDSIQEMIITHEYYVEP